MEPGTVIVTTEALNGMLEPVYELPILGKKVARPSKFDADLVRTIVQVIGCFAFDYSLLPEATFVFSVWACIVSLTAASRLLLLHFLNSSNHTSISRSSLARLWLATVSTKVSTPPSQALSVHTVTHRTEVVSGSRYLIFTLLLLWVGDLT